MKKSLFMLALALVVSSTSYAQVTLKGIVNNNRYDDGDQLENKSTYVGWLSKDQDPAGVGKSIFASKMGIYKIPVKETLVEPVQYPYIPISEYYSNGSFTDVEKALLVNNTLNMYGNSGSLYANGQLTTIFSRDYQSTPAEELFCVRQWDAATSAQTKQFPYFPEDKVLECAGLSFNPLDKQVYGLFYVTSAELPLDITSDPDYFVDEDEYYEGREGQDAGYAIGVINLENMEVSIITPGLYYYNFVTFAINSEGRAFAMTSGGTAGVENAEGKMEDINGNLTGATLCEFDLATGKIIKETASGYCSQYRRQAACFAKSNPNKMYWIGYFNSGKGIGSGGSWTTLPDNEWRTNGKYDTALYEIDVTTGNAERIAKIKDRYTFSCLWVDGDDCSDGQEVVSGITNHPSVMTQHPSSTYNLAGQRVSDDYKGIVIKNGRKVLK